MVVFVKISQHFAENVSEIFVTRDQRVTTRS